MPGYRKIKILRGRFAFVSNEDYDFLSQWNWTLYKGESTYYAVRTTREADGKMIFMHRVLLGLTERFVFADHKDFNGLNNRRENIRIATPSQNQQNRRKAKNKSSRFKGVSFKKQTGRWCASMEISDKGIHLGYFDKEKDAANAYNIAAKKHFGEFANLNKI